MKQAFCRGMMFLKKNASLLSVILWSWLVNSAFGAPFKPVYIAINVFLVLILASASKKITVAFLLSLSFSALILFPVTATFGKPSINMVTAILYANGEEAHTTLKNLELLWLIPGVITIFLAFSIIKNINKQLKPGRKATAFFLIFLVAVLFIRPLFVYNGQGYIHEIRYPPFISLLKIYDSFRLIKETDMMVSEGKTKKTDFINATVTPQKYDTYIMVIGESVRRDYMNAYGFPFNNTPFLSSSPGIFFDNYVSASFATVPSLMHTLIRNRGNKPEYNNTVIRLAKEAGLKTYWLSNQGFYGFYDSPVAIIGMQADHYFFTKKGDGHFGEYSPDTLLLPEIKKSLASSGRKLIVIHLAGSHVDFCKRVTGKLEFTLYDRQHSCYVQSIKNTDRLLQTIASVATASKDKWTMLYFGDHGLSHMPVIGHLSYRDNKKQNYAPPFTLINYDSTRKEHITALRSGLDFMKMFAQWTGINVPLLAADCDYFTQSECITRPMVYDENMKLQSWLSLTDDSPRY